MNKIQYVDVKSTKMIPGRTYMDVPDVEDCTLFMFLGVEKGFFGNVKKVNMLYLEGDKGGYKINEYGIVTFECQISMSEIKGYLDIWPNVMNKTHDTSTVQNPEDYIYHLVKDTWVPRDQFRV